MKQQIPNKHTTTTCIIKTYHRYIIKTEIHLPPHYFCKVAVKFMSVEILCQLGSWPTTQQITYQIFYANYTFPIEPFDL